MATAILGIPTMQDLAIRARNSFGRNVREEAIAATMDTVVEVYSREGRGTSPDQLRTDSYQSVSALLPAEPAGGRDAVHTFVDGALRFLAFQYPQPEHARQERGLLSTLFRAHLEEAKLHTAASEVQPVEVPSQPSSTHHPQLVRYLIKEIERERARSIHHLAKMHEYLTVLEELDPGQAKAAVEHLEGDLQTALTASRSGSGKQRRSRWWESTRSVDGLVPA